MPKKRTPKIKKVETQASIELGKAGLDVEPIEFEYIEDPGPAKDEEYLTNLERLYGPKGPPDMTGNPCLVPINNVLRLPPPQGKIINGFQHAVRCTCQDCKMEWPEKKTKVRVMQDSLLKYPDLYLSVFVATTNKYEEAQFAEMFTRSQCRRAKSLPEADLVIFTGGSDVDPILYGEPCHNKTRFETVRDKKDIKLYKYCLKEGIPMFGVCRGAQFLWVMNRGKLYQNVNNHVGDHSMWDLPNQAFIDRISSVHHQMVKWSDDVGATVIGTSNKATERVYHDGDKKGFQTRRGSDADVEAFFVRSTGCFGVQGHPEYRTYNHYSRWCLEQINSLFYLSPDYEWRGPHYRMKADLIAERGNALPPIAELYIKERENKNVVTDTPNAASNEA